MNRLIERAESLAGFALLLALGLATMAAKALGGKPGPCRGGGHAVGEWHVARWRREERGR